MKKDVGWGWALVFLWIHNHKFESPRFAILLYCNCIQWYKGILKVHSPRKCYLLLLLLFAQLKLNVRAETHTPRPRKQSLLFLKLCTSAPMAPCHPVLCRLHEDIDKIFSSKIFSSRAYAYAAYSLRDLDCITQTQKIQ